MKTQIIQLESHDDVVSTRDKMGWGQAARIVLVWPAGRERILNRQLDLVLLQRHCTRLGSQMALVVKDSDVAAHARELNIPVFTNLREAQRSHWRSTRLTRPSPKRPWPRPDFYAVRQQLHPHKTAWHERPYARQAFYTSAFLILMLMAALLLPRTRISLQPQTRYQELELPVWSGEGVEKINFAGELPARLTTVVVEGRDSLPSSGSVHIPNNASQGWVHFSNLTADPVEIPVNTVVATRSQSGVRFVITQAGVVPAGPGESVRLPVQAMTPGEASNVLARRLTAVEGPLGLSVTVVNQAGTQGGSSLPVTAPTRLDYEQLYENLHAQLRQTALAELQAGETLAGASSETSPQEAVVLLPTLKLSQVVEASYTPEVAPSGPLSPGDEVSLLLRLEFQALVVSAEDLNAYASAMLNAALPEGYLPLPESLQVSQAGSFKAGRGGYGWTLKMSQQTVAAIDERQASTRVRGLEPAAAQARLYEEFPLARQPRIDLVPAWWPRLPVFLFQYQFLQEWEKDTR